MVNGPGDVMVEVEWWLVDSGRRRARCRHCQQNEHGGGNSGTKFAHKHARFLSRVTRMRARRALRCCGLDRAPSIPDASPALHPATKGSRMSRTPQMGGGDPGASLEGMTRIELA